jgi:hypothetical protein
MKKIGENEKETKFERQSREFYQGKRRRRM